MLIGCQLQIIYRQHGGLGGPDSQRVTHHSPCFQAPNSLKARNTETGNRNRCCLFTCAIGFGLFSGGGGAAKDGFASAALPTRPCKSQETGLDEDP